MLIQLAEAAAPGNRAAASSFVENGFLWYHTLWGELSQHGKADVRDDNYTKHISMYQRWSYHPRCSISAETRDSAAHRDLKS